MKGKEVPAVFDGRTALEEILGAQTEGELAAVVRSLPPPVELTPPARRRQEPLEIFTAMGEVRLDGRWQVSRITKINAGMGPVTIDLTGAEFDDWDVEIVVHTTIGEITVIVPRGFDVRLVGRNGAVKTVVEPPVPGFPVVRLSATSDMGTIRVVHPREKTRRRRWRRRRQPTPGPRRGLWLRAVRAGARASRTSPAPGWP
ncbi:MAG: LiaF domain-containing protein [Acidimicrobiales bacterium]